MVEASPIQAGNSVLIRTVTFFYTGRIVGFDSHEIVLESAAWVASTGRFAVALTSGQLLEVEPYPDGPVSISRAAIVDVCLWAHDLPRETL
jgi:hypothetical protein